MSGREEETQKNGSGKLCMEKPKLEGSKKRKGKKEVERRCEVGTGKKEM